jgi:hypothetical protein
VLAPVPVLVLVLDELEQAVARTAASPTVTPAISGLRIPTRVFSFVFA